MGYLRSKFSLFLILRSSYFYKDRCHSCLAHSPFKVQKKISRFFLQRSELNVTYPSSGCYPITSISFAIPLLFRTTTGLRYRHRSSITTATSCLRDSRSSRGQSKVPETATCIREPTSLRIAASHRDSHRSSGQPRVLGTATALRDSQRSER